MTLAGERNVTPAAPTSGCWATKPDDPIGWCSGHGCYVDRCPPGVTHYISLWQPWASLWVGGAKMIETRGWATKFRGRLAVHAGKRIDVDACYREPFRRALAGLEFDQPADLPLGAIVGWVTISDCLEMGSAEFPLSKVTNPRLSSVEVAFGAYSSGRFAWITNRHRLTLPTPIPMRGLQRIQKLPADIAARFA